jgi:hypothetical protein
MRTFTLTHSMNAQNKFSKLKFDATLAELEVDDGDDKRLDDVVIAFDFDQTLKLKSITDAKHCVRG